MTKLRRLGWPIAGVLLVAIRIDAGQAKLVTANYRVLAPVTQDNLTIFPVATDSERDTHEFLTLDEGLRSGEVVITEEGGLTGLARPRPGSRAWQENTLPEPRRDGGAEVTRLMLSNNSIRPLLLLAGEI